MQIGPTYQNLLDKLLRHIRVAKNLSVAGMHDSGKSYLIKSFKQLVQEGSVFFVEQNENVIDIKSLNIGPNQTLCINFGFRQKPSQKQLSQLYDLKQANINYILFSNYSTYKSKTNYTNEKVVRLNFEPILPLNKEDLLMVAKYLEQELGSLSEINMPKTITFSGGNPGLFKQIIIAGLNNKKLDLKNLLMDEGIIRRLDNISSELESFEISIILGQKTDKIVEDRLKLFGYLNSENKPFSKLFSKYLITKQKILNSEMKMSVTQKKVFELLKNNLGKVVDRDAIAEAMWGKLAHEKYSDWAIDTIIKEIRQVLTFHKSDIKIITKRGGGYTIYGD